MSMVCRICGGPAPDPLDAWNRWAASLGKDVFIDWARCRRMLAEERRAIDDLLFAVSQFTIRCASDALGIRILEKEKEKRPT